MKGKEQDSHWISFSDIMTGLMVIFMFIAISYILEVQKRQAKRDELFEDFHHTKEALRFELDSVLVDLAKEWNVEIDKDLSIKITDERALFDVRSHRLKPGFKKFLDEFVPKYLGVILQDKYSDKISEVRIEGHTGFIRGTYMGFIGLSQRRSNSVLEYILSHSYYSELTEKDKDKLKFWMTSNGLAFGRALDENGEYVYNSGNSIDNKHSLRVEFRIVTTSEKLVDKVLNELISK